MSEELSKTNIIEALGDKLGSYLDSKDSIFENNYVEVFGDSFKVVGLLRKASKLISQKRFEAFLKGFKGFDMPTEEQLTKLMEYIDNEQKAEFIADTMQKILLSKSTRACLIMGILIHDLTKNKEDLNLEDLVCLEALTNFFDHDIDNYKYICNYARSKYFDISWSFKSKCKEDGFNFASILLTVEKAVAHQLLAKEIEVELDIDSDDVDLSEAENNVNYSLTSPGNKFYDYILRISEIE
jgi:hypothetical protein